MIFSRERKNEKRSPRQVTVLKTMAQLRLASVAVIPNDVRGRRNLTVGSQASSALQQGRRKRLSGATRQSSAPTSQPRPPRCRAHLSGFYVRFALKRGFRTRYQVRHSSIEDLN